jgi:tRNA (cmo5U34)-methyltransferase
MTKLAKVGQNIETQNAGWTFDGKVADTFVDHVRQSVPLYEKGHELVCQLSDYFVDKTSTVYEIGTSTGELIRKVAPAQCPSRRRALRRHRPPSARW